MPRRKESKEPVVYPASKRKALPFKPPRPSKVPRIPTTESESSQPTSTKTHDTVPKASRSSKAPSPQIDDDEDDSRQNTDFHDRGENSDSDEELDDDPLAAKPKRRGPTKPAPATARRPSIGAIQTFGGIGSSPPPVEPPLSSGQSSDVTQVPQPLLVRLLHEHFANKQTKIDKHATSVLQKYIEIFVRESIARTALAKKQRTDVDPEDAGWLELEDLEKIAPGMMLDF